VRRRLAINEQTYCRQRHEPFTMEGYRCWSHKPRTRQ
jgi:hypothetical protein